jgi:hypothetical protein
MVGLAVGLWAVGCAGNLDPSLVPQGTGGTGSPQGTAGTGGPAPCDALTMILGNTSKCASVGCHGMTAVQGVDLMSPGVVARLVGRMPPATSPSCATSTMPYLVPNSNPPMGLLLSKLMEPVPCGSVMPFAGIGGALTPADMTCITEWSLAAIQGRINP